MKKNLLWLIFICLLPMAANAQGYKWLKGGGSTTSMFTSSDYERVTQMCTDSNDNVYISAVVGDNDITADTFYMASAHNTSGGTGEVRHMLLASYQCDGTMRWAKLIESSTDADCYGLAYDGKGNIYCIGNLWGITIFGGYKYIGTDTVIKSKYLTAFIAKFDTSGNYKWVRFIGPDSSSTASTTSGEFASLAIDGNGWIHYYKLLGSGVQITPTVISKFGTYDITYDSSGTLLNAVRMPIDSDMEIYSLTMNTKTNTTYANIIPVPSAPLSIESYLACYDHNDVQQWADTFSSGGLNQVVYGHRKIYATAGGSPYIAGGDTLLSNDASDIMTIDTNGKFLKAFGLHGSGGSAMYQLALLNNGRIAATGILTESLSSGHDSITTGIGNWHPFLFVTDTNENTILLDKFETDGLDNFGEVLVSDKDNNIYIGGQLVDTIAAGNLPAYHTQGGNTDFFVAKYGYSCNCTPAAEPTPAFTYSGDGTVTFSYTGSVTPDSVRWNFNDGSAPTNAASPTHYFHDTGEHQVCLTVYACDSGTVCQYVHTTEAVPNVGNMANVGVYPNPAHDVVYVEGATSGSTIKLYNMVGQAVYSGIIHSNKETINVSNLPDAMYVLELTSAQGTKAEVRIVKR